MTQCRTARELEAEGPITLTSAEMWAVSIPMTEPFRISSGVVSQKEASILRLCDGKHFGWGESSAMPGAFYSADTPESCEREIIERVLPAVIGCTFATMLELECRLLELQTSPFVRVAIETAAWEILANRADKSLREFFGMEDRPVRSGLAVGLYDTVGQLHEALERYGVLQYSRLKIKIKRGQDLMLVRGVREWYGEIPLFVDANADYSMEDIDIFRELDAYGLMMLEQPFRRADLTGASELQRSVRTPVCFDEGIETVADVQEAAVADACRIVNIKLQRVGGFLEAFRIAEACAQHNMPAWMGTMPELGIGSAQALVFAAHPQCLLPTDVEPSNRWYQDDILRQSIKLDGNAIIVPKGPGLGYQVDASALERYSVRHVRL